RAACTGQRRGGRHRRAGGGQRPGIAGGVACWLASPEVSYFFGKTPVWPVPPQKTLVPTRSFWPRPEHFRQRRYEPLYTPPKCLPLILQVGHLRRGWMRVETT